MRMLPITARLIVGLVICLNMALASEFAPIEQADGHSALKSISNSSGALVLSGVSYKDLHTDIKGAREYMFWIASCDSGAKCLWVKQLELPDKSMLNDSYFFDSVVTEISRDHFVALLYTGKEDLYEIQEISAGNEQAKKTRIRLPKEYRFGHGGPGSGGVFFSGTEYIVVGVATDRKGFIAMRGKKIDELKTEIEHKTTQSVDIVNVIDGILFYEVGDTNKFGGGERRIEAINIRPNSEPKHIINGKFSSVVKTSDGYRISANRNPVFPKADLVIYNISRQLDWVSTIPIAEYEVALPYPLWLFTPKPSTPCVASIGSDFKVAVYNLAGDNNAGSAKMWYNVSSTGAGVVKGYIESLDKYALVINTREIKKDGAKAVGVRNYISIAQPQQ